ncbi:class I SAM-dependent methyltransferase [Micromonospora sp. NPDC049679]|uniref:class I SAM-dependent methyltransferase n=1 Tax=Micromonospora sp. NPDC049679 TaxID=3155920 RepID=UPI003401E375
MNAADQATTFDAHERRLWTGRALAYERTFAKLCAYPAPMLLDAAGVHAGVTALDVGTGSGTVAALACARGAVVTAVDAERGMVELTRRRVPAADVRHGLLPDLPFPDGVFDAAVANFVINHVGDPAAALGELRRLVRPGGRIAVTVWPHPPPPLQRLWWQAIEAAGARRPDSVPRVAAELDFERSTDGLTRLLSDAALTELTGETITWEHRAAPDEWWSGAVNGIGTSGLIIASQTPEMIAQIKGHYDRLTAAYLGSDGLLGLPTAAVLAAGRVG